MRSLPRLLLPLAMLAASGCLSVGGGSSMSAEEVTGTYAVEDFTFRPEGTALRPINVLEQFDAAQTRFRIFANERVSFQYALRSDGLARVADGTYDLDGSGISVRFGSGVSGEIEELVVPRTLTLSSTGGGGLEGHVERRGVVVAPFSEAYQGIGPVNGTFHIRLRRLP